MHVQNSKLTHLLVANCTIISTLTSLTNRPWWMWIRNQTCRRSLRSCLVGWEHYNGVITSAQISGISIVCSTACSGAHQRKHQSSASLAFARGIHRWPVDSPHKWPVRRKLFPFDDVIKRLLLLVDLVKNELWVDCLSIWHWHFLHNPFKWLNVRFFLPNRIKPK